MLGEPILRKQHGILRSRSRDAKEIVDKLGQGCLQLGVAVRDRGHAHASQNQQNQDERRPPLVLGAIDQDIDPPPFEVALDQDQTAAGLERRALTPTRVGETWVGFDDEPWDQARW